MRSLVLLALLFGPAHARGTSEATGYELHGFSADGKYVFVEKHRSMPPVAEKWLAVYDAATTKLVTSQPIWRDCNVMESVDKPDEPRTTSCKEGRAIDEKSGAKVAEKIHKTYGAAVATTKLAPKSRNDRASVFDLKGSGQVEIFAGTGIEVKVISKAAFPVPPAQPMGKEAGIDVEIVLVAGATKWTAQQRVYAMPVDDPMNFPGMMWDLGSKVLAVAPNHEAVALVFANKPIVIARPKK